MKKAKYNQKYWKEQYYNENNIKQWFKNFLTYCPENCNLNIKQQKQEFLQGERAEIQKIITSKEEQEKIYKFIEKIINEIEV